MAPNMKDAGEGLTTCQPHSIKGRPQIEVYLSASGGPAEAYLLSHCCNSVITKVREKYDGCKGHQDIYSDLAGKESWEHRKLQQGTTS